MRHETPTTRRCRQQLNALCLDKYTAFHKAKLILEIYRDVVWALIEEIRDMRHTAYELGEENLESDLRCLAEFAPDAKFAEFGARVCELTQSKMSVDAVDRALVKLRGYPENGELYFEILTKRYVCNDYRPKSKLFDALCMERSVFYDRKKEAVHLFPVCLFGYMLPELQDEMPSGRSVFIDFILPLYPTLVFLLYESQTESYAAASPLPAYKQFVWG